MRVEARPIQPVDEHDRPGSGFRRDLNGVDFTLLVIGAAIGADVYIVAAIGAQFLGPAQIVAWLAAGVLAALVALAFVQCAAICPNVGGSYAYTREAFGPFVGFLAGWALYIGEWIALPVFPIALINYLGYFVLGLSGVEAAVIKVSLVVMVTSINIFGVRSSGRLNDVLTAAKLVPLALLILAGLAFAGVHWSDAQRNLTPFTPLGWGHFGAAVVPIFWAYAGFELAVLPAAEVREPRKTLPRGLLLGMSVVTIFYLLTSFAVVVAPPWTNAAAASRPVSDAMQTMLVRFGMPGSWGEVLMSAGALVSILGVFVVFLLSVARLSYAMASDGLFPGAFARIHPRFATPYVGLIFQAGSALVIGAVLDLTSLIDTAVFFLGICYLLTALAALRLTRRFPDRRLHIPFIGVLLGLGAAAGAVLVLQAPPSRLVAGMLVMAAGLVIYAWRRHIWRQQAALRRELQESERRLGNWMWRGEHWLLRSVRRRPVVAGAHPRRTDARDGDDNGTITP